MSDTSSTALLTVLEVAEQLRVSRGTVYNLIADGILAAVRVRGSRRVTRDSLTEYLAHLGGTERAS
jgi:excisionase family DNA binding protein